MFPSLQVFALLGLVSICTCGACNNTLNHLHTYLRSAYLGIYLLHFSICHCIEMCVSDHVLCVDLSSHLAVLQVSNVSGLLLQMFS